MIATTHARILLLVLAVLLLPVVPPDSPHDPATRTTPRSWIDQYGRTTRKSKSLNKKSRICGDWPNIQHELNKSVNLFDLVDEVKKLQEATMSGVPGFGRENIREEEELFWGFILTFHNHKWQNNKFKNLLCLTEFTRLINGGKYKIDKIWSKVLYYHAEIDLLNPNYRQSWLNQNIVAGVLDWGFSIFKTFYHNITNDKENTDSFKKELSKKIQKICGNNT